MIGRRLSEDLPAVAGLYVFDRMPHPVAIEALRRSLFTVAPSLLPESFGIVALEAAAAGKPTIASDIGGLRDLVCDGETGYLVSPGDTGALAGAIGRLCAEDAMRGRMGEAAARRAKLFGPDQVVPRFEDAYREARELRLKRATRSGR